MSSARNYSIQVLHGMFWANAIYHQKLQKRFEALEARLLQRPGQTGALTSEQQDLNKRVKAVSDDFTAIAAQMQELDSLFVDYDEAQPNDQPQLRNQIQAKLDDMCPMNRNLGNGVQALEEIKE